MKYYIVLLAALFALAVSQTASPSPSQAPLSPSSSQTPSTPSPSSTNTHTTWPYASSSPSPSVTPFPQMPGNPADGVQFESYPNLATFRLAQYNFTDRAEYFNITLDSICETLENGTAVHHPFDLNGGSWHFLKYQHAGETQVFYYKDNIVVRNVKVEVDMVVAIARNDTVFYTIYGNHTLETNDVKLGLHITHWPFEDLENRLNVTFKFTSSHHNDTEQSSEDDVLTMSEFGAVDDDDYDVLHIDWEPQAILDDLIYSNFTIDQTEHYVTIQFPHFHRYAYYDPVMRIQESDSSSSDHTVLIVVLCVVGGIILLACVALIVFFIWKRRRQNYEIIE